MQIISHILSKSIGTLFILSSALKAVNVQAFAQTINSFLTLLGMDYLYGYGEELGIIICTVEMLFGLLVMHKAYERIVTIGIALMMAVFTYVTYINYTNLYGGIESCGCFGELIHLTASETFFKNIVLLIMIMALLTYHILTRKDSNYKLKQCIGNIGLYATTIVSLILPVYSYFMIDLMAHTLYIIVYVILCIAIIIYNEYVLYISEKNGKN